MTSRRLWILALMVAFFMIAASSAYIILSTPEPLASDMVLTPADLGNGWNGTLQNLPVWELEQHGLKSGSGAELFNETFGVSIGISIYNSQTVCREEYDNYSDYAFGNHSIRDHVLYFENLTLGERSFAGCWDSVEYPLNLFVVVQKGNILWTISFTFKPLTVQPWWKNATLAVAHLQDEKIKDKMV
jgi:hypothetical protein